LNKGKLNNLANDIWGSAERLRRKFKAYEYQNVILPTIKVRFQIIVNLLFQGQAGSLPAYDS
jgi:hypothetical protein